MVWCIVGERIKTIDEWIEDKYKNKLDDSNCNVIKKINNLSSLISYLDWNYRHDNKLINCKLACEFINYRNYQTLQIEQLKREVDKHE